jgi:hypothetical protein
MQNRITEQTIKHKSHSFGNTLLCAVFHHIRTIEECKFIDRVDGREVGQYECCRCNKRFMANSKRSCFRVYN